MLPLTNPWSAKQAEGTVTDYSLAGYRNDSVFRGTLRYARTFLQQYQSKLVLAKMWAKVPNRWNSIAVNWITNISAKKNTKTKPIGSSCRYSFVMCTYGTCS